MRKGAAVLAAAAASMVLAAAGPAQADETPPRHGHILVLGLELDATGEPIGFRKCVDLAAGKPLPLGAHHAHAHTGKAGEALWNAGHAVVPTTPYGPFENCAEVEAIFG